MRISQAVIALIGLLVLASSPANEVTLWNKSPRVLDCTPSRLSPHGVLTLHLGPKHGPELGIRRTADDTWYFLVSKVPFDGMKLLMSAHEFAAASEVKLSLDDTLGYVDPEHPRDRVFTVPGEYDIYTSNALESEEGGFKCAVRYSAH